MDVVWELDQTEVEPTGSRSVPNPEVWISSSSCEYIGDDDDLNYDDYEEYGADWAP